MVWLIKRSSHSAKIAGGRLHPNMVTPLIQGSWPREWNWNWCAWSDLYFKKKKKKTAGGEWIIKPSPQILACEEKVTSQFSCQKTWLQIIKRDNWLCLNWAKILMFAFSWMLIKIFENHTHHHHIYPLTARVVGAPQMISQPVSSIFPCSALPCGTWWTPGLSIPWCCLPTSSCVCLVFFPLSRCLARWFWPDLMNGRCDHTTAVCVSLQRSGGLCVVWLPAGSWHRLPVGDMVFVWNA